MRKPPTLPLFPKKTNQDPKPGPIKFTHFMSDQMDAGYDVNAFDASVGASNVHHISIFNGIVQNAAVQEFRLTLQILYRCMI